MKDAFGNDLVEGDTVIGIANMGSTQTFYYGTITQVTDEWANVEMVKASTAYIEKYQYVPEVATEKRVAFPHRLVKV
jgi:hypothetical protein